jgi:hypothetical protein
VSWDARVRNLEEVNLASSDTYIGLVGTGLKYDNEIPKVN